MTNSTITRPRPRFTARRVAGALAASAAVAFGGVSALPDGVAQAAGVDDSRVQHVSSVAATDGATVESEPASSRSGGPSVMRIRVDADGNVIG